MDERHEFDLTRQRCVRCGRTREQCEDGYQCEAPTAEELSELQYKPEALN